MPSAYFHSIQEIDKKYTRIECVDKKNAKRKVHEGRTYTLLGESPMQKSCFSKIKSVFLLGISALLIPLTLSLILKNKSYTNFIKRQFKAMQATHTKIYLEIKKENVFENMEGGDQSSGVEDQMQEIDPLVNLDEVVQGNFSEEEKRNINIAKDHFKNGDFAMAIQTLDGYPFKVKLPIYIEYCSTCIKNEASEEVFKFLEMLPERERFLFQHFLLIHKAAKG